MRGLACTSSRHTLSRLGEMPVNPRIPMKGPGCALADLRRWPRPSPVHPIRRSVGMPGGEHVKTSLGSWRPKVWEASCQTWGTRSADPGSESSCWALWGTFLRRLNGPAELDLGDLISLRHLRSHGSVKRASPPPSPVEASRIAADAEWLYRACIWGQLLDAARHRQYLNALSVELHAS